MGRGLASKFGVSVKVAPLIPATKPHRVLEPAEIDVGDDYVQFGGVWIKYDDIIECIFNEDNVENDGIGGSLIVKYLAHDSAYVQNYKVRRFTYSEAALENARVFFERVRLTSAVTERLNLNDSIFREAFYAQP